MASTLKMGTHSTCLGDLIATLIWKLVPPLHPASERERCGEPLCLLRLQNSHLYISICAVQMVVRSNAQPRSVPIAPAPLAVTPTGTLPEAGEAERRNGQREMHLNDPVGHGHIEGSLFRASNLFEKWSAAHPGRIFHRPHIHSPLEDPVIVWRHPLPNPKAPADIVEGHSQLLIGEWNAIGCSKKQMPAGLHGVVFSSSQDLLEVCGDTVVLFVGSLDVKPNMYLYYGQYIVEDAGRTISQEAWSAMAPAARLVMIGMMGPLFSTEEEYVRRHTRMFRLRFVGYDSQFAMRG
ncbi:hypothetical protein BXZ70DRAFT_761794 [Cristinia sonorae]|uniref:DUF6697 domain-containing protein n=1 Tax=Cristinia sonorae TaxID=1940300 RepID=A0A8K0UUJ6_9AGAR|nr:hypothetical protein BXZ70DRAFT_761794 [Cristinia sonorae]